MRRRTIEASREIRLWLVVAVSIVAAFPEARNSVVNGVRKIVEKDYPGQIKDKIHEITKKKEE